MGKTAHTLDVRARLSGDAARGMKSLGDSGVKAGKGMTAAFLKAQIALGAIRAAARGIVGLMRGITTESIDRLDKISKTSRQIGVSAEFLSSVGYAAEQSGIKSEVLVRGIRNVSRNMRQVAGGSKELIKVYDELGFTTEELADLARRGPEAAFRAIAKAVGEVDDETQRVSLAMRALGEEAGPQLLKMVEGGLGAMDKYVADAHRLGLVVTQQQGEMAEAASEAIGEFEAAMTGVKNAIAVQIMPVLTPLLKKLATWIAENRKAVAAFFVEFVAGVVHVTIKLGRLYDVASTVFGGKGLGAEWPKAVRSLNEMVRDLRESVDGIPASPDSPLGGVHDDLVAIGGEIVVLEPRVQSFWDKMTEGRKKYAKTEAGEYVVEGGHLKLESQIGGMKAGVEALAATATPRTSASRRSTPRRIPGRRSSARSRTARRTRPRPSPTWPGASLRISRGSRSGSWSRRCSPGSSRSSEAEAASRPLRLAEAAGGIPAVSRARSARSRRDRVTSRSASSRSRRSASSARSRNGSRRSRRPSACGPAGRAPAAGTSP
jgi:hypothetical protein